MQVIWFFSLHMQLHKLIHPQTYQQNSAKRHRPSCSGRVFLTHNTGIHTRCNGWLDRSWVPRSSILMNLYSFSTYIVIGIITCHLKSHQLHFSRRVRYIIHLYIYIIYIYIHDISMSISMFKSSKLWPLTGPPRPGHLPRCLPRRSRRQRQRRCFDAGALGDVLRLRKIGWWFKKKSSAVMAIYEL